MTSAEDGGAETTQYLILQGPDDGKGAPGVFQWRTSPPLSLLLFWQWVHSNGEKKKTWYFLRKHVLLGRCSQQDTG